VSGDIASEVAGFVRREVKGQVALFLVVRLGAKSGVSELKEAMRVLGLDDPVILDEDGRVQQALGVKVVPSISLVDREGVLRVTRATTLSQPIFAGADIREVIRTVGRGDGLRTIEVLERYYPAEDLVGKDFRDVTLPERLTGRPLRLADHVKPGRLTGVLYWSPRCPYSRKAMSGFVWGMRDMGKFLDIVSVVREGDDAEIRRFAEEQKITFPILEDRDRAFSRPYRAISTPTFILIGPDGVIDSVNTTGNVNYYTVLMAKVKALILKPAAPAPSAPAGGASRSPGP
jgi:peroxiredoxin